MVHMSHSPKLYVSILFMCIGINTYGQIFVKDDFKRELWKSIKPESSTSSGVPAQQSLKAQQENITDNKYINAYENYKYKSSGRLFETYKEKLKINPNLTKYNSSIPLMQRPAGYTQSIYMGGHFYNVTPAFSGVGVGGLDLSFAKRKKLSEKSKAILRNVFGMEIED